MESKASLGEAGIIPSFGGKLGIGLPNISIITHKFSNLGHFSSWKTSPKCRVWMI